MHGLIWIRGYEIHDTILSVIRPEDIFRIHYYVSRIHTFASIPPAKERQER
jgi:hypothetical protein